MAAMADLPKRLQRRRTKGWTAPAGNYTFVGRGTPWGNPFKAADSSLAVAAFRAWVNRERVVLPKGMTCAGACAVVDRERLLRTLPELRGRDLMCWCPPDQPCHADVLIEMANAPLRCEAP